MRVLGILAALAVTACGFRHGATVDEAGPPGEAAVVHDAPSDGRPRDAHADAPRDGSGAGCNQTLCQTFGGNCNSTQVCVISVTNAAPVTCPTGLVCEVDCDMSNACKNGIDCSTTAGCTVHCNQQNSCQGGTNLCPLTGCTFYCKQDNTCDNETFGCGTGSGACVLECCGASTCGGNGGTGTLTQHQPGTCP